MSVLSVIPDVPSVPIMRVVYESPHTPQSLPNRNASRPKTTPLAVIACVLAPRRGAPRRSKGGRGQTVTAPLGYLALTLLAPARDLS